MVDSGSGSSPKRHLHPVAALQALADGPGADPLRRAMWLDALDQRLRPLLPPGLAAHARLANVDGNRLVYLVDAPAWHARLRLASTPLLEAARSFGLGVTHLVVRTRRLPPAPDAAPQRQVNRMSQRARETLDAALASLREDLDDRKERPRRS